MGLKSVKRTAITCWSPATEEEPYLALGTVAGALDASFSSKTELEIFSLNLAETGKGMTRIAGIPGNARFNRISWGRELLACGKENGEMELLHVKKVLSGGENPIVFKSNNHSGAVRGLHFNPTQTHLLASGATDGEIFIWDLNELNKPYAPGAKSQRLEDVTCLAWNKEVPHILASGSSNGYTVVWDLRNRKELIKIPYPGGRKPVTAVSWNPDKPTQMVTCSDDDANPVILMWDLRNASAAEKTLTGHSKGILSMDWCPKDSELLLSCGKDNRTIVWNASTGEAIGDLAHSSNWSFDTKWCPRNPDLCVTASFDGKVVLHSIQNAAESGDESAFSPVPAQAEPAFVDPNDPFAQIGIQDHSHRVVTQPTFCLPHPPKWLRRPVGAVWGFGGRLAYFESTHTSVSIKSVPINEEIAFRADQLDYILRENNPDTSAQYCDYMANSDFVGSEHERNIWLFLKRLFSPESRDNMSDFVGYTQDFNADERLSKLVAKLSVLPQEETEVEQKSLGPFTFYSNQVTEETDTDKLVTKAIIVGDFDLAVSICLGAKRFADALVLAVNGSPELLQKAQKHYFDHMGGAKTYIRVLRSVVEGDLLDLIATARLDSKDGWKDLVSLICTYSKPERFSEYFATLGDKVSDPSFSGIKDKAIKDQASALCFLGAGDVKKLSYLWFSSTSPELETAINDKSLQGLAEQFSLFRQAIKFQDPALALESSPDEVETLKQMYNAYVRYAWTAAVQGSMDTAWRFLEQVPLNFIPSIPYIDIFVLRDRVYSNRGQVSAISGQPPTFPFESVDVQDVEALRLAAEYEEKQRIAAQERQNMFQAKTNQIHHQTNQHHYGSHQSNSGNFNQGYQPQSQHQQPWGMTPAPPVNQWQQPHLLQNNQWNQPQAPPPPANQQWQNPSSSPAPWNAGPAIPSTQTPNQWNAAPPQMNHGAPPIPGSTGHDPSYPPNHFQPPPPVNQHAPTGYSRSGSISGRSGSFSAPPPVANYGNVGQTAPPPPIPGAHSVIRNSSDKACYDNLIRLASLAKSKSIDKKDVEEAEKNLTVLHSQFCSGAVQPSVTSELQSLCLALDRSDFSTSQRILNDLMTKRFDATGTWIVGVKRIVDTLERVSRPVTSPMQTLPSAQTSAPGFGRHPPPPSGYGNPYPSLAYGQQPPPPVSASSSFAAPPPSNSNSQAAVLPPPVKNYGAPPAPSANANNYGAPPVPSPTVNGYVATPIANAYGAPPVPTAVSGYGAPPTPAAAPPLMNNYGQPVPITAGPPPMRPSATVPPSITSIRHPTSITSPPPTNFSLPQKTESLSTKSAPGSSPPFANPPPPINRPSIPLASGHPTTNGFSHPPQPSMPSGLPPPPSSRPQMRPPQQPMNAQAPALGAPHIRAPFPNPPPSAPHQQYRPRPPPQFSQQPPRS